MKTRILGKTNIELSVIGLGTWAVGEEGAKNRIDPDDDRNFIDTILKAVDTGINWVDTAPSYGFGCAENIVGKAMKILKKKPFISTKCGLVWEGERIYSSLSANSIRSEIEASLGRLGIDAIDLYQIHKPAPEKDIEDAWGTLAKLVREGKVRYAGVSNFSIEQLERLSAIRPVDFVQLHYSMLLPDIEEGLLAYCAQKEIGVVTHSPMERGLLAGKIKRGSNFALVERLRPIAGRNDMSMSQLAIAWILRRPEIASVIAGARLAYQIEETALSADFVLPEESLDEISRLLENKTCGPT